MVRTTMTPDVNAPDVNAPDVNTVRTSYVCEMCVDYNHRKRMLNALITEAHDELNWPAQFIDLLNKRKSQDRAAQFAHIRSSPRCLTVFLERYI